MDLRAGAGRGAVCRVIRRKSFFCHSNSLVPSTLGQGRPQHPSVVVPPTVTLGATIFLRSTRRPVFKYWMLALLFCVVAGHSFIPDAQAGTAASIPICWLSTGAPTPTYCGSPIDVANAFIADTNAYEAVASNGIIGSYKLDWFNILVGSPAYLGIEMTGLCSGSTCTRGATLSGICPDGYTQDIQNPNGGDLECILGSGENPQKDKSPPEASPKAPNTPPRVPPCDGMVGDPCNSADGNNHQVETDYAGTGPVPLTYQRTYNSIPTGEPRYLKPASYWRTTYDRSVLLSAITSLTSTSNNDPPPGGLIAAATVERPNGDVYYFTLENGQYVPDSDINDILTQTASGWTYSRPDGTVETYDASGRR